MARTKAVAETEEAETKEAETEEAKRKFCCQGCTRDGVAIKNCNIMRIQFLPWNVKCPQQVEEAKEE